MTPAVDAAGGGPPQRPPAPPAGPPLRDEVLPADEVDAQLAERRLAWQRQDGELVKTVQLPTFPDAVAFVGRVAQLAEAADHHPDIDIRWRTVTLRLSTHSVGGLTAKDLALAAQIDEVA